MVVTRREPSTRIESTSTTSIVPVPLSAEAGALVTTTTAERIVVAITTISPSVALETRRRGHRTSSWASSAILRSRLLFFFFIVVFVGIRKASTRRFHQLRSHGVQEVVVEKVRLKIITYNVLLNYFSSDLVTRNACTYVFFLRVLYLFGMLVQNVLPNVDRIPEFFVRQWAHPDDITYQVKSTLHLYQKPKKKIKDLHLPLLSLCVSFDECFDGFFGVSPTKQFEALWNLVRSWRWFDRCEKPEKSTHLSREQLKGEI